MTTRITTLLTSALLLVSLGGCGGEGQPLTVQGTFDLDLAQGDTGFEFEAAAALATTPEQADPGCAAGGCVLSVDDQGQATSLDIWISRGADGEQGLGFRTFELAVTEEGTSLSAAVAAVDGTEHYRAEGGASCVVTDLGALDDSGFVELVIDCDLATSEGDTAVLAADLFFSGCVIE